MLRVIYGHLTTPSFATLSLIVTRLRRHLSSLASRH